MKYIVTAIILFFLVIAKINAEQKNILISTKVIRINSDLSFDIGHQLKVKQINDKEAKIVVGKASLTTKSEIVDNNVIKVWFKTAINDISWNNVIFERETELINGVPQVFTVQNKEPKKQDLNLYLVIVKGEIIEKK